MFLARSRHLRSPFRLDLDYTNHTCCRGTPSFAQRRVGGDEVNPILILWHPVRVASQSSRIRSRQFPQCLLRNGENSTRASLAAPQPARAPRDSCACSGAFRRLSYRPEIEVIVAALPELRIAGDLQLARSLLLERLNRNGQRGGARLAQEQMHVFRHEHIASDHKTIPSPHRLQMLLKTLVCGRRVEQGPSLVTTEGEEMK